MKISYITLAVGLSIFLSACSVYKASENDGVSVSDIRKCDSKMCFLAHGMKVVDHKQEKNGQYTEIYRAIAKKSGFCFISRFKRIE